VNVVIFALLLLTGFASAATLHGGCFDWATMERLPGTYLDFNSTPEQRIVAENGSYYAELAPGAYAIKANYYENGSLVLSSSAYAEIASEGDYRLDVILTPALEGETPLVDLPEPEEELAATDNQSQLVDAAVAIALVLIALLAVKLLGKGAEKKSEPGKAEAALDDEARGVLEALRENGGRMTQRELRRKMPQSEAKVSLVVSELEARGFLKKFKKGRGNILVLEKKIMGGP